MRIFKFIMKPFKLLTITLGCMLGIHAWKNNVCVNCGKTR